MEEKSRYILSIGKMDEKKKIRTPLRTAFTKAVNSFDALLKDPNHKKEDLQAAVDSVERKAEQIADLDKAITEEMVEKDATEEEMSLSLNDCLVKGQNLLEVVSAVILRFRLWKYGLLADIKKAFLQISIHPDFRDYLRFLWQENSSKKMKIYRHRRLVFGLTCSSFVLAALINEILATAPPDYQATAKQLKNANYVDNCVTSVKDEEAVEKFIKEATQLLATKQFELRGWEWNSPSAVDEPEKKTTWFEIE